jgi:hypothetical protein
MPVEQVHAVKAGSPGATFLVFAHDGSGRGVAGLGATSPGARCGYARAGDARARPIDLATALDEVDAELVPGVYSLAVTDDVLAEGSERAMVVLRFADAVVAPLDLHLVRYDPQDSERMGVLGLTNSSRHEFLRRALPRLTELEYELGAEQEQALRRQREEQA